MAAIKSVARSATVAFAPTAPDVLALGTMAGAIDSAFSTSASLDLCKVNFASPDPELPIINSFTASERFNRLSWGTAGAGGEEHPYGLIAGGLADGSIGLWNPAPLISNADGLNVENSLLAKMQRHAGHVRGLEFNVITPNLLASGSDDGEIYIWDLVDPTAPSHFPPLKGGGSGAQGEIAYLSWNRKVQHILASTSYSGASVVWDLKRQKPVLSFTDPNSRRRCSALQWNPDVATQLIVASDDDRSPSLQVWDLRNSVSPVKELVGHTKGVLAMAWCPIDSALLLTCAKDNRTLCWDTFSGEIICELPVSSNWNFDVQWSPRIAGVLSTSSFDGRVNIYNIEACSRTLPSEGVFGGAIAAGATASMRAPRWLKRPAGVSFGFGGKLVSFGLKKAVPGVAGSLSELKIQTIVTEEELIHRSEEFEAAIADPGNKSSMRALCERKAQASGSEEQKEIWSFLEVMFDENPRTCLLSHLGFIVKTSENGISQEEVKNLEDLNDKMQENLNLSNGAVENVQEDSDFPNVPPLDVQREPNDDGTDFFNNLETPKGTLSPHLTPNVEKEITDNTVVGEEEQEGFVEEDDCDKAVQHALVIGDFKEAVQQCLAANRVADALVLANVGGPELWEKTLVEYMRKNFRPYRKVMAAIVARDIGNLVNSRPLKAWKETLAVLCSYADSQDWSMLSDALAARLDAAGNTLAAMLCYICAANVEEVVKIWYRELISNHSSITYVAHLQDLMEKTIVLALAKGEKRFPPALAKLVGSYVELLASQGILTTAMEYLGVVPPEDSSQELSILRDRICKSVQANVQAETSAYAGSSREVFPVPAVNQSAYMVGQTPAPQVPLDNTYPVYPPYPVYPSQDTSNQTHPQPVYPAQEASYQTHPQAIYPAQETSHQAQPPPGIFYPTPPAHSSQPPPSIPQSSFVPPPVKSFSPMNPPNMGNFFSPPNQYPMGGQELTNSPYTFPTPFQPASSAPQPAPHMTFPGPANPPITAAPNPRGFMPVSGPRAPFVQQQPSMLTPAVQPQSPSSMNTTMPSPSISAAPAPPTIQNADTSNVAADLKPVITTLLRLYNETSEAVGGVRAVPAKKREIDDNSRKLGTLFAKLNSADISPNARAKLIQLCQSLDAGDYSTALQIQVGLTTSDWDECGFWLAALKRMIKARQTLR